MSYDSWKLATPPEIEAEDENICCYCDEPIDGNKTMCKNCASEQAADAKDKSDG